MMRCCYSSFASSPTPHLPGVDPQKSSIISRLDSCKSTHDLKQIHCIIIKTRPTLQTQLIYTKIISICCSSPDTDPSYINAILTQIPNPSVSIYNAIIRCFSGSKNENHSLIAMLFYCELLAKGLVPDNYTYPFLLKACAESSALREGQEVHARVVKNGFVSDLYVVNTLMRMYAVCGVIGNAQKVFDESPVRDLVSWTTLIQGYVKMGFSKEGVNFDVFVGNALVDTYLKCGDADLAHIVFDEMPVKNVVSWNSMISGLAQQGAFKEALIMFRKMQSRGVEPDNVTLIGVLNSCANLGMLELGKWVHAYVYRYRINADGFIWNAKCGSIDEAFEVFDSMKLRDIYTYNTLIVGLAMHGPAERALALVSEMPKVGIEPNGVTYVGVLMACSHEGLVEEGCSHFAEMERVHDFEPQIEHYGCMVDLLGRAGLVNEAYEFIKNMPIEPDAFVWGALLAENVMEKLVTIEPERDGAYILMSNIYSSANKWRDALKLRKAMKQRKMRKTSGCSSIELDGVVREFRKGDKSHRKTKEMYILLDQMSSHLKNGGQWACTGDCS